MTEQASLWVPRLRLVMLMLFAALPLVTHTSVEEHIYVRVPYLLGLATLIWLAAGARATVSDWVPPRPPLAMLSALWLLLAALSMRWALSPQLVPVALFRDFVIMTAAGAFAMMAAPRRGLALGLLGVGAFVSLAFTLTEHFYSPTSQLWRPFYQSSLAGDYAAAALAGSFAALVCGIPRGKKGLALALGGLLLVTVAAATLWRTQALTASGAALAGCATGFLASRGKWGRRIALFVPLGALLLGGGILYYYGSHLHHPSAEIRFYLWKGALNMLLDNPLGGVGYGGFGAGFPMHRPEGYWGALYATTWSAHAHSLYLELAATLGVPGLLLSIVFVPLALLGGLRLAADAENHAERATSAAIIGAFTAVAVAAIADLAADYPLGRWLFFALAGLAYSRTAKEDVEGGRPVDLLIRRGLLIAVSLMLVLQCLFVEIDVVKSRIAYRHATLLQAAGDVERDKLLALPPSATELERSAQTARLQEAIRNSIHEFERAVSLPRFETEWTLRGRLLIASQVTQLAAFDSDERKKDLLYRLAKTRCAEVEQIATDFEDNELIYAIIELERGDRPGFEKHIRNYIERRLGWDLRANVPGQRAPVSTAWSYVLERVSPSDPVFQWVRLQVEERAKVEAEAERAGNHGAKTQARHVAELFRLRAEGE